MGKAQPRVHGRWNEPTPTSLRREQAEKFRRVADDSRRDHDRESAVDGQPRPAPVSRPLTPEELAKVAELSQGRVVRPPMGHHARAEDEDRAGLPCACGTEPGTACGLHAALYAGSRRRVRPT
jgi:hypothetical protein